MDKFYEQQQQAHDNLVRTRGGLLFWKVGTGKTRVALSIFATLQTVYKWPMPCICLYVCKPKCFYDIRREIILIGMDCVVLENDYEVPYEVQVQMLTKPTILLFSHAMLAKRLDYLRQNKDIRMVLLDDGYIFKNPKAEKTKAAAKLTVSRRAVLMSGSVMTQRNLCDIYGQAYAVNQHRRMAPNFTGFRSKYLFMRLEETRDKRTYPKFSPKPKAYESIVKDLGDAANFYFPENKDRKVHHQILEVLSTPEQDKLFAELKEWYSAEAYNIELDFALQVSQQLQRVSNGWITSDHKAPYLIPNNKIARCRELVEEIIEGGERCVIWCAFKQDVRFVCEALPFATLQMSGDMPFDIKAWESGKYPVVVCTEASGVGVNHFEQVPYAIYFSMDWAWLALQQSRGRTDRKASKHDEVFYYYLHTQGGIDRKIYDVATSAESRESTLIQLGAVRDWLINA
jgi:hypothetical protein